MTQYDRVKNILNSLPLGRHITLYGIQRLIKQRYDVLDSEQGIAARIREIRREWKTEGVTITAHKWRGKTYEYSVERIGEQAA